MCPRARRRPAKSGTQTVPARQLAHTDVAGQARGYRRTISRGVMAKRHRQAVARNSSRGAWLQAETPAEATVHAPTYTRLQSLITLVPLLGKVVTSVQLIQARHPLEFPVCYIIKYRVATGRVASHGQTIWAAVRPVPVRTLRPLLVGPLAASGAGVAPTVGNDGPAAPGPGSCLYLRLGAKMSN